MQFSCREHYFPLDIDECIGPGARTLCALNTTCVNTIGSFNCICNGSSTDGENFRECEGDYVLVSNNTEFVINCIIPSNSS